jgi:hypothetical protein
VDLLTLFGLFAVSAMLAEEMKHIASRGAQT